MNWTSWNLALAMAIGCSGLPGFAVAGAAPDAPKVSSISDSGVVTADWGRNETWLETGQSAGAWSLIAVVHGGPDGWLAVFEDFSQTNGHLLIADTKGVKQDLPKSSEPTRADPKSLYRGHSLEEVIQSEHDLLGEDTFNRYAVEAVCERNLIASTICLGLSGQP
jgi:hypothetical protein